MVCPLGKLALHFGFKGREFRAETTPNPGFPGNRGVIALKKILSAIGVLLVLLIAAVLIGPGLVDGNQYKADIQAQAKKLTGRALTINGDIRITVLPAPALIANDVSLANVPGAAAKSMVSLKYLEVRVAMAPLLSRTPAVFPHRPGPARTWRPWRRR